MPVDDALRWLDRLERELNARQKSIRTLDEYYEGNHPLEFASDKFQEVFGGSFDEFSDNWCDLVVDAPEERLQVTGFRFGDEDDADEDANRIWQANQLDAQSQMGHTEALITGEAAVTVWADPASEDTPKVTVEHPSQVIVATDPGNRRRRLAALKMWKDEWTGDTFATVYLEDGIYKFREGSSTTASGLSVVRRPGRRSHKRWEARDVAGESWPLSNPLEAVPVVPLVNRPRLLKPGQSEIKRVIPVQDAVNKMVADMLVASELGAFPARWAVGWSPDEDPETRQQRESRLTDYFNRFLWTEGDDGRGRFGQFDTIDLKIFVTAIEMLIQHIASQTRTPPHYFYLRGEFPSGESIKSAETGLVAKVRRKSIHFGEAWEEVMRLVFAVLGDGRSDEVKAETIWSDFESRSESEHIDSVVKLKALGVPTKALWEKAGFTPQEISRFDSMLAEDILLRVMDEADDQADDQADELDDAPSDA